MAILKSAAAQMALVAEAVRDIQYTHAAFATVYYVFVIDVCAIFSQQCWCVWAPSQPLLRSWPLLRGLRNMRNACCTYGAGWTDKAVAWDEYINPALCSGMRVEKVC